MKAVVCRGEGVYAVEDNVPIPKVTPDGVLVRVRATGICGTDLHVVRRRIESPIIPGHEWAGEVVEVGPSVKGFQKGDHVVGQTTVPCFSCTKCSKEMFTICPARGEMGIFKYNGGFANYLLYPNSRTLYKIDKRVPFTYAATVEPLCVAVAAVSGTSLQVGETVVILGDGPIGLFLLQVCKAKGASVVVVGGVSHRLKIAQELGADATFNGLTTIDLIKQLEEKVKKMNNGNLANLVIEATGNPSTIQTAIDIVEPGGTIILLGSFSGKKPDFQIHKIIGKNITIKGHLSSAGPVWPEAIKLIESGKVNPEKIISHKFSLEDFPNALRALDELTDNVVKVMVIQGDSKL